MATFTQRGNRWRAEVVRLGVRKSQSFSTKRRAELWAAEIEAEILSGRAGADPTKCTLYDALDRYAREKSPLKRGEQWELVRLKKFQREMPFVGRQLSEITPDILGKWRDESLKHLKPDSVRREFGLLSAVFEAARKEWRLVRENPCRDVVLPDKDKARVRRITDEEAASICAQLGYTGGPVTRKSQEAAVALLVAIETAMRAGEIMSLERDQVDFERRVAHLLKTKNGDERDVPLSTRAAELLKFLPGKERLFTLAPGSLDSLFRRATKKAKVEGMHFHDSRREAATRLAAKFDVMELARITGHRDINLLHRVYYRPSVDGLVSKLD